MSEKNKAEIPEEEIQAEQTVEEAEAEAVDAEDISDERDEKIGKLEAELAAQKDKYMRLAAEYDNYRKRTANEKLGIYDDATSKAVTEILPVADSVRMALENLKDSGSRATARSATNLTRTCTTRFRWWTARS